MKDNISILNVCIISWSVAAILDSDVGFSLTVGIESSTSVRRLQITPLLTTTKNLEGKRFAV